MKAQQRLFNVKEIENAFTRYFYGSGDDFFFPHPKLDNIPKKECKEIVKIRRDEFLEVLNEEKGKI